MDDAKCCSLRILFSFLYTSLFNGAFGALEPPLKKWLLLY